MHGRTEVFCRMKPWEPLFLTQPAQIFGQIIMFEIVQNQIRIDPFRQVWRGIIQHRGQIRFHIKHFDIKPVAPELPDALDLGFCRTILLKHRDGLHD